MGLRLVATVLFLTVLSGVGRAQEPASASLLELLSGPERTDIPYKVSIEKPALTFQQHYLVLVNAEFPAKIVGRGALHHLYTLTKLQDADGRWLPGEDYDHLDIPEHLRKQALYYSASIYLRPGKYRVSILMFDGDSRKANVFHRDVVISPLKNDPFPQMDASLPEIEFPDRVKGHHQFWMLGDRLRQIPIPESARRLDVVLNITKRFRWDLLYRMDVQNMLEAGSVVGHLHPANGCVRLSVIDALRTKVLLDRFPADKVSWTKLQQAIEGINQDVIDVKVLANQKRIAQFTHDYLQGLAGDKGCDGAQEMAPPLVVVVSPDVVLPDGNEIHELTALPHGFYAYLHVGLGDGWQDGMGQILSSAKPERMKCANPKELREALPKIVARLSEAIE
jgi:hypothetical protein